MTNPDNSVEVVDTSSDRSGLDGQADLGYDYVYSPIILPPEFPTALKVEALTDEELLAEAGVEPVFSTSEAAEFFDRSSQWLYWGLREGIFTNEFSKPILPDWVGDAVRGRRRFTLPIIREIAKSSYRRGNFTLDQLKTVMLRARYAELGVNWREQEGWRHVGTGRKGHRWVHPSKARYNKSTARWELKPKTDNEKSTGR